MRKERQKGQDRWVSFSHVTKVEAKVVSGRAPWFTVYGTLYHLSTHLGQQGREILQSLEGRNLEGDWIGADKRRKMTI